MSDARGDPTVDAILEESRPYYNHRLYGEAVEPILPKALDPGENVVGVFRGSMNRFWINYRLGIFTNITWLMLIRLTPEAPRARSSSANRSSRPTSCCVVWS